jgi:rubrerythrin
MAVDFKNSETRDNLMRAFAGESQARNRYTFAAAQAKEQKLQVLERIFQYTADQEKEHAEIFYDFLKEMVGETIHVDGGYPVDFDSSMAGLLRMAEHNELEEYGVVYKAFGDKAKEEGFTAIAYAFYQIAEIEKSHAERFGRYAQWMEQDRLFSAEGETYWMCLNCGHIHKAAAAPGKCPVCHHDQGYFVRLEEAPWTK